MMNITSDQGHIGPFWWINSNTTGNLASDLPPFDARWILWGTSGWGRDVHLSWKRVNG